jgi:hypothetical protein
MTPIETKANQPVDIGSDDLPFDSHTLRRELADDPEGRLLAAVFPTSFDVSQEADWGHLMLPPSRHLEAVDAYRAPGLDSALRVAVFGSFYRGFNVIVAVGILQGQEPEAVRLVGAVTDEVTLPGAKISLRKRVWQYVPDEWRESVQCYAEAMAMGFGASVLTGRVKSDFFRSRLLPFWNPDVILQATFGQIVDQPIIDSPRCGIYNFHPSDLAHGKYPGGDPFRAMLEAGEPTTRMTIHQVDPGIDTGKVVGFSPEVNLWPAGRDRGGYTIEQQIMALHGRTALVAAKMASALLREIHRTRAVVQTFDFEATSPLPKKQS